MAHYLFLLLILTPLIQLINPSTYRTLLQNRTLLPRIVPSSLGAIKRLGESAIGHDRQLPFLLRGCC
jgi:hypothetical protein